MTSEIRSAQNSSVFGVLFAQMQRDANAPALCAPQRDDLSYGSLFAHIKENVAKLHAANIKRNERVAIVLPNGPEMASAFLSVASCATAAPLNPAYGAEEFDFYLSDLDAKALIVQADTESPAIEVARKRGIAIIELVPRLHDSAGLFDLRFDALQDESATTSTRSSTRCSDEARDNLAQPDDIALVLHTSGTTSRPKIVPLSQRNLCASARNIGEILQLSPRDRCLNVMPLFHIHGLVAATLASLASGASVCCTPGFYAPRFFEWLHDFRATWYTAVPTMHQSIVARAADNREIIGENPLRFIRSSSSALAPQIMHDLEAAFGAPVIEAYGMTEAAHQMASNPLPPRARKPGSVGIAAGPEIAIMNDSGELLPQGATGEIVIRGENITPGYDRNPEANTSAFIHGWFRTGDQGFLDGESYLILTGRLKEIINRGGEKISPREIDEILLGHAAVAQAVAFAIPHAQLGEEVAAVVVLKSGATATPSELREYSSRHLAHFKVPSRIVIVDEIPKGATGKIQRIGLAEKLGLNVEAALQTEIAEYCAPRTPHETMLCEIWQRVLGVERVGVADNFFALGGDSMLATQTVARMHRETGSEITLLQFFDAPTVAQLAAIFGAKISSSDDAPNDAQNDDIESLLAEIEELSDEEAARQIGP